MLTRTYEFMFSDNRSSGKVKKKSQSQLKIQTKDPGSDKSRALSVVFHAYFYMSLQVIITFMA